MFCASKKWWYLWPHNSDQAGDLTSYHWSNNFKGLYNKKNIYHGALNMSDSHLWVVFAHHILKHGSKAFPSFDYDKNKYVSYQTKEFFNTNHKANKLALKIIWPIQRL